jgi:lipoyl(octanoyl) transferase
MRELLVVDLGRRRYADVLSFQREVAAARIAGDVDEDVLLLVEHEPVITLGRSSKSAHMLATPEYLQSRGVDLFEVERGGDVTFHGPGQLVGYPIIDLKRHRKDLHWYLRQVEQFLIDALATYGLDGGRRPAYTGVWLDDRKIASIGVHARDWVTWHGFALNVTTDLRYFDLIVPCGIQSVRMTSLAAELPNAAADLAAVAERVVAAASRTFDLTPRRTTAAYLSSAIDASLSAASNGYGR